MTDSSVALPDFARIIARATTLRRELHQHPELAWQEHRTAATIRARLDELGIPWRACAGTGTLATLAPRAEGPHLAFRGDIDALPIHESTDLPWQSTVPGRMHACGHDGHTATLVGLGGWLKARERDLPGPVTLLFQPAEEGGHGAERMIEDGAMAGIDCIYGWHNWPAIPFGRAVCPNGTVMAANGTFRITVSGRGGHAAQPEACANPVTTAAAITVALQHVLSGRVPPQRPHVLTVSSIDAASNATVIPPFAVIEGTIRCARTADRDHLYRIMAEVIEGTARAHGTTAHFEPLPRYVATVNHPGPAAACRDALRHELGEDWQDTTTPLPIMASEDFSYYLQETAGAFALIGADDGPAHQPPCHNPAYDFNDALLAPVIRTFARLAGAPVLPAGSTPAPPASRPSTAG
ncbi:MAG: amidohydrolase [Deltaproteobacteria bacterium]|nr:MAG: amidohydrolase [Deltaproteobacteria bacterium]